MSEPLSHKPSIIRHDLSQAQSLSLFGPSTFRRGLFNTSVVLKGLLSQRSSHDVGGETIS